jgi:putative DNA primase/helicase
MTARKVYCGLFEFTPKFKLWLGGNHKPDIKGGDYAIWRRIRLIPFAVTIPEADRDPNLPELLRDEFPGILNWALEGCRQWQTLGLMPPTEVTAAGAEYRSEMDVVGQWIGERCVEEKGKTLTAEAAYRDYHTWAEGGGLRPMTKQALGRKMTERGVGRHRTKHGGVYQDIGLTDALLVMVRAAA